MAADVQPLFDEDLQPVLEAILALLRADPFFADVTTMVDDEQELAAELKKALATLAEEGGRNGTACVIEVPDLGVEFPNLRGPQFDEVVVDLNFLENVLLNRGDSGTRKTARRLALAAARSLHHKPIPGLNKVLLAQRVFKKDNPDTKDLIYALRLKTGGLVLKQ